MATKTIVKSTPIKQKSYMQLKKEYLAMSPERFEGVWNSRHANLKSGKLSLDHQKAIADAMPIQQKRADEQYRIANEIYMREMKEKMRLLNERMRNQNGGDMNDPDERIRAGTHKRITVSTETGSGKGRKEPVSYVVPIADADDY